MGIAVKRIKELCYNEIWDTLQLHTLGKNLAMR